MKLKSETISNVLRILLWVLVGLAAADLVSSIIYAASLEVFTAYVYDFYGFIEIVSAVLYYIAAIVYLVWIYLVHKDMNLLFPHFTRSPGSALACMLVPVYNLYGIPSIYSTIGRAFMKDTSDSEKEGRWIGRLASPLLLFIIITNALNRLVSRVDELGSGMLVTLSLSSLILYTIFLALCIQVSRGLNQSRLEHMSASVVNGNSEALESLSVEQESTAMN